MEYKRNSCSANVFFWGLCLLQVAFAAPVFAQPVAPSGFKTTGYDSHIELRWNKNPENNILGYRVYRQIEGEPDFSYVTFLNFEQTYWLDFTGQQSGERIYRINAITNTGQTGPYSVPDTAATQPMTDEELLDMVQAYTFRYFWDFAHPVSGLARERNTSGETVTIGGSGFGVMAILVAIERGFITREEGLQRLLKIVLFLETADRFYGVFPHWMNGTTGEVVPFSSLDNGGDLVETAFLIQGLLTVREYFSGNSVDEIVLRTKITQIWEGVNWNWYRKQNQNVLFWHWSPNHNFAINHQIRGYNEALIIYLLAVASPTYGVPAQLYHLGWAGGNYTNGSTYYGYKLDVGPARGGPLFFAHYSFMGFDPRNKHDNYADYFDHNRNHTLVNRAYCIDNPENHPGYSEVCWGLTASDDPFVGYLAHEATADRDNGTISPTAALSSMPYTPAESMAALVHFYRDHGDKIWGPMGFYDAFNIGANWYAKSYLAIDQGPIINMIENHRTGLLWDHFMANPEIQTALDKIGFVSDPVSVQTTTTNSIQWDNFPNPAKNTITSRFQLVQPKNVTLRIYDSTNRLLFTCIDRQRLASDQREIDLSGFEPGIYFLQLSTDEDSWTRKVFLIH